MEKAIQVSDPARWQKHLRRRNDPPGEEAEAPRSPRADADEYLRQVNHGEGECPCSSPTALQGHEPEPSSLILRLCAADVCEDLSPPRVGMEAGKFGLTVVDAMDLTTGWDFNLAEHRRQAEEYVDREKPFVLIGSPPCVAFSQLQTFVKDSERKANQLAEGIRHMEFVVKLYRKQVEGGECSYTKTPPTPSRGHCRASGR